MEMKETSKLAFVKLIIYYKIIDNNLLQLRICSARCEKKKKIKPKSCCREKVNKNNKSV